MLKKESALARQSRERSIQEGNSVHKCTGAGESTAGELKVTLHDRAKTHWGKWQAVPCRHRKGPDHISPHPGKMGSNRETLPSALFKENHSGSRWDDKFGKGKVKGRRDKTLKLLQKSTPK